MSKNIIKKNIVILMLLFYCSLNAKIVNWYALIALVPISNLNWFYDDPKKVTNLKRKFLYAIFQGFTLAILMVLFKLALITTFPWSAIGVFTVVIIILFFVYPIKYLPVGKFNE